ncbi:hypothetical protein CAC42_7431 [Sphaceloma murrayae]|uniref:Uncharacterized protein n=1 Tax=Sphaceloma murrayae TaxID=2082308 RepID=A0A2K1QX14_9PEZI|nr:hypothetical protein CAC42_7431 [Sphaceloma murrayae]
MATSKTKPPKHEPRIESLRIPGSEKKPRPQPLRPLRQPPAPPKLGQDTVSIRRVDDDGSSSVYNDLLRKPSVETRCSTLKSDILNYYLTAGTSNASVTALSVIESLPVTSSEPVFHDFNEVSHQSEVPCGNIGPVATAIDITPSGSEVDVVQASATAEFLPPACPNVQQVCTLTAAPQSEGLLEEYIGFDFALDSDGRPDDEGLSPPCLSLDAPTSQSQTPTQVQRESTPSLSPPPVPTPTYSLFPTITTPPTAGLVLPSTSKHTRNTSSSSSILYTPSDQIFCAQNSDLPTRPLLARLRSPTTTSHPSTPSSSTSASTVRPSSSTVRSHVRSSSSRWSNDTVSRPLLSPTSRNVSFGFGFTGPLPRGSGADTLPRCDHVRDSAGSGASHAASMERAGEASEGTTPRNSVTSAYIRGRKRMSRPLLSPMTFESVPVSFFEDDDSEAEEEEEEGGWRGWGRRGWMSRGKSVGEERGNFVEMEERGSAVRGGVSDGRKGRGSRGKWRLWLCCS